MVAAMESLKEEGRNTTVRDAQNCKLRYIGIMWQLKHLFTLIILASTILIRYGE